VVKSDIVNAVAKAAGLERRKAMQAVETIIDVLRAALLRGERIERGTPSVPFSIPAHVL